MQRNLGCNLSPNARNAVRTFSIKSKGIGQFVVNCLNNLPNGSDPTSERLWPWTQRISLGWTDDSSTIRCCPSVMIFFSLESFIDWVIQAEFGRSNLRNSGGQDSPEEKRKFRPVIIPSEVEGRSNFNPSYHPSRLLLPMLASPTSLARGGEYFMPPVLSWNGF